MSVPRQPRDALVAELAGTHVDHGVGGGVDGHGVAANQRREVRPDAAHDVRGDDAVIAQAGHVGLLEMHLRRGRAHRRSDGEPVIGGVEGGEVGGEGHALRAGPGRTA